MTTTPHPQAVLFDMDGVLCISGPVLFEAARRLFQDRYATAIRREDVRPFVGAGETRYLQGLAAQHGVTLDWPADLERTLALYYELSPALLKPVPGAAGILDTCRRRGLRTAVATSAGRTKLERNLAALGLAPSRFDAAVTGEDLKATKPDPEVFLVAAQRVGCDPRACVVVEDAINGVVAAKRAGCRCLALTTSFPDDVLRAAGADAVAVDLADADRRFDECFGADGASA